MATYTLSFTGAQINAAIGNATDLFSTAHTWTAAQTLQTPIIAGPTITGTTYQSTTVFDDDVTLQGGKLYAGDIESSGTALFDGDVTCTSTLKVSSAASFVCEGSATFSTGPTINGETDIDGDLIVTGGLYASGPSTFATITGTDIFGSRIESTLDVIAGRSIRINSDKVKLSFVTEAGTMSADGVYISTTGITAVAEGDPYPANVLLIEFDY